MLRDQAAVFCDNLDIRHAAAKMLVGDELIFVRLNDGRAVNVNSGCHCITSIAITVAAIRKAAAKPSTAITNAAKNPANIKVSKNPRI
jgi:hypothetical protein